MNNEKLNALRQQWEGNTLKEVVSFINEKIDSNETSND